MNTNTPSFAEATKGRREWAAMKNCAASAAHASQRVGLRVAPESTAAALSDRNDGQQSFSAARKYPGYLFLYLRVLGDLRVQNPSASIRVHSRLKKSGSINK